MDSSSDTPFSRRDFVAAGTAAGLAASLPAWPAGRPGSHLAGAPGPMTLLGQREALAAGQTTSAELVENALGRIATLDRTGPMLRAMLDANPAARDEAAACDAERRAGRLRGPLHGLPILLKDNIDTVGPMTTTAGSLALEGTVPTRDATVTQRLRAAGAIILGKTNLSEWANFRSTHSSSGWSGRGGQARNPYALDRSPSGSSSGSGVAVAAGYCAAAIGTETDGSVTSPAAANSLVGIKPTVGLISRAGIIPISHSQDTAGPMTRTVADAALLLSALAGTDPRDAATATAPRATDYLAALGDGSLKGMRLGVARKQFTGYHPALDARFEEALKALQEAGAELVEAVDITAANGVGDAEFEVLQYEFKADLAAYLATRGPDTTVRTLADIIAFNTRERDRSMPFFLQETLESSAKKGPLTDPAYKKALAHCRQKSRLEGIDAALTKHRVDALVMPTQGPAWPIDLVNGDCINGGSATRPAAVAGYPHITVPMGYTNGLPVGLSFMSGAWREAALLRAAYAYEKATQLRKEPTFAADTFALLGAAG